MTVKRRAEVLWHDDLLIGRRALRFDSDAVREASVSLSSRNGAPNGMTSPEELLTAASASCFVTAFSNGLAKNNTTPNRLDV